MAARAAPVLALSAMTRNIACAGTPPGARHDASAPGTPTLPTPRVHEGRSIVLVGLMGAGKTSIGRRLAGRLGLPFRDADAEIERAAGCPIADIFARHGEPHFRDGERRVIRRLLSGEPIVLATGGGAFVDPETRAAIREEAVSVWLRCPLPVLVRRVAARTHRPLLQGGDAENILRGLLQSRGPIYAEADVVVDVGALPQEETTGQVLEALARFAPPRRLAVSLSRARYQVVVGDGLLARAGALLAPVLPGRRCVVVTDETVASLFLPRVLAALAETGFEATPLVVPPGEASKDFATYTRLVGQFLDLPAQRGTAVLALGGGVVGDLAGFAAATVLRGLPFVQMPTTLLAQVDSSVGGKTGINMAQGKNLLGAFHQPVAVIADTGALASLPRRELGAGYAEILKAGLIGDADLFGWCEANGARMLAGDAELLAEAVLRACAFKAGVVGQDEYEERAEGGRALLNLGHTFAHAFEAESGYGTILHGAAVGVGLGLALELSARLGHAPASLAARVRDHLAALGLPARPADLPGRFDTAALVARMRRDKKMRDERLTFVLASGIGAAFVSRDVPEATVRALLLDEGCTLENG